MPNFPWDPGKSIGSVCGSKSGLTEGGNPRQTSSSPMKRVDFHHGKSNGVVPTPLDLTMASGFHRLVRDRGHQAVSIPG